MADGLRLQLYEILESSSSTDRRARWSDRFLMALILANVLAVIVETVEEVAATHRAAFWAFDVFSVAVFTIEYIARAWICVEDATERFRPPMSGRLRYLVTPMALIDLAAILPFYLGMLFVIDLRFLRVFRLPRLLKLTRYSPALETVGVVLYGQRRSLGAAFLVMLTLLIFTSSVVYLFEHRVQPEAFANIPRAMWWALATLTTVGYGDVTPATPWGKLFGGLTMVLGVGMFALPAGIIASGFADEIRKRDFVVSWRLVAGVPLFRSLDAIKIAEVAHLLKPKVVPTRYAIVRRGEPADSMYFIVSGEVEVEIPAAARILGPGNFFGEIALLKECDRTATVTAVTECQLLYLDRYDFNRLLREQPDLRRPLEEAMEVRLAEIESRPGNPCAPAPLSERDRMRSPIP